MLGFLQDIPDDSREHQDLIGRVKVALQHESELAHIVFMQKCWLAVSQSASHSLAKDAAKILLQMLEKRQLEAASLLKESLEGLRIEENPWWRLLQDMQGAPILKGVDAAKILPLYSLLINIILTLPDELRDKVKEAIRLKRGFRGIWEELKPSLAGGDDEEEDAEPEAGAADDSMPPRQRPKKFWQDLAKSPTLNEAMALSEYDGKTIRQYLKDLGITPAWALPHRSSTPRPHNKSTKNDKEKKR